jgi:hypothetical protein
LLQEDVLATRYVQADETRIQVLSKLKISASYRGQIWIYFAPTIKATFFNYEPTRSTAAGDVILESYQGTIQSDGYSVYQEIAKRSDIIIIFCVAHSRRKFHEAKEVNRFWRNSFSPSVNFCTQLKEKREKKDVKRG